MVDAARKRVSYAEYLAIANDSDVKYEYVLGEVVAMAGGTVERGGLIGRAATLIDRALEGRPRIVLPSDLRVRIRAAERATYPDLHVVCGPPERDPDDSHAIVNPTVMSRFSPTRQPDWVASKIRSLSPSSIAPRIHPDLPARAPHRDLSPR